MPMVEIACEPCAGHGWKQCPVCPGDGKARCLANCQSGVLPCPAHCNEGYSSTKACQYCSGGDPSCTSCEGRAHMRCESCNPHTHKGMLFDRPGMIRCPAECDAGYFPCPVCATYNAIFGAGKVGCDTCHNTGLIAVHQDDPPDDPAVA